MRPVTRTQTGVGTSAWVPLDYLQVPFNVGFGCVVTGSATYTVQHTFDTVTEVGAATPTAFDHQFVVGQTTSKDGNYAFPVRAIRINQTVGAGSVAMTVLQGLQL